VQHQKEVACRYPVEVRLPSRIFQHRSEESVPVFTMYTPSGLIAADRMEGV
jgi:hypothetical protein